MPHVLIVEDEANSADMLATVVRGEGFTTAVAGSLREARQHLLMMPAQVVLLDLRLPGLEGEAVLRRLRQTSRVPVIVISAKREEDDRVAALDMGADDYVVKPFTVRELAARIRAVLRRSEGESPDAVTVGEVLVDFPSRTASQAGVRVPLTAQEFVVLGCLVHNRGRLVTRATLDALLHPGENPPADAISNVIDVIVLRLRKKLGHDLITTRRGQGFIIDG